jgi:hypothetical protein
MIVGIDDTGTVALGQQFMVVVVMIRPSSMPALVSAFERWKKLSRRQLPNRPDEVKSTDLTNSMYRDFVNKVVFAPGVSLWYQAYGIVVNEHALEWGRRQRDRFVSQYQAEIDRRLKEGGGDKWTRQASTLSGWIRSTPPGMQIKMAVLDAAFFASMNQSIVEAVLGDFDEELGEMSWAIDLGFLKDRSTPNWKELLRSGLIQATQREPLIQISEWKPDHPFLKTFFREGRGKFGVFTKEFTRRIQFYDSARVVEIQVADIIAGIMRKKFVKHQNESFMERLAERIPRKEKGELHVLLFSDLRKFEQPPPSTNPYDELRSAPVDPLSP